MLVKKEEFNVEVTDAKGVVKIVCSDKLYETIIKRNPSAKKVQTVLSTVKRIKAGEAVTGDDIALKGMTIRRIP